MSVSTVTIVVPTFQRRSSVLRLLRSLDAQKFPARAFDVVVANLTAEVIIALMADLADCMATPGRMILSGILTMLAADVERALEGVGLRLIERRTAGEWTAIAAARGEA